MSSERAQADARLESLTIGPDARLRDAMRAIENGAQEIAVIVDRDGRLAGTVTDGDIRRALLAGGDLSDPIISCASRTPHVVTVDASRAEVLDLMRARSLAQIPVVDGSHRFLGLHTLKQLLGCEQRPNAAVIIAGGRGTRLGLLTHATPKPMLPVAGRPILEHLVLHLVGSGIRRIVLSVAYLGDQIERHFGDGSTFGCAIDYVREDPEHPLGTGGPLALIDSEDRGRGPLLVLNGDLVTRFSVGNLLDAHAQARAVATVALRRYTHEVPFGVAEVDGDRLRRIVEKPALSWLVNAGIYVIEPTLLSRIPRHCQYPLPALIEESISQGEPVAAWECTDDWQDVGQPAELASARGEL